MNNYSQKVKNENSKKPILNEASVRVRQMMSNVGLDYYNHNEYVSFMKMAYSGVVAHAE